MTLRWKIGDVTVTRIVEATPVLDPAAFFPKSTPEGWERHRSWLEPHFYTEDGKALLSIHMLVVESQGQAIVVDCCVGNDKTLPYPGLGGDGSFLDELRATGYDPASVDTVLCTHLHFDHVGWNTRLVDGRWVPTFPNARYLFGRIEWEHWSASQDDEPVHVLAESVRPVLDAGLADLVESTHRITDEVWLEPTPGHTPGHHSVHIASGGAEAVITGDMTHHPVQIAEPDWGISADVDADAATVTRQKFIAQYGDTPVLVIGTHYAGPTAGHIVRDGDSWRFQP
jgi:glyoxylase-like metal-dependent hydrolase (beta-lactamase superfamily II)